MPVAVVTGGASGFGLALVERCATLGMDVAVLDLDGDRAVAEAARVAAAHSVQAVGMAVDLGDAASVDAAAAAEPYVITHGDLTEAVMTRSAQLTRAAEASRGA